MRPKHFWDMTAVPKTDSRGLKDEYADAVDPYFDFHNFLEENNPDRVPPKYLVRCFGSS